jgi:2-C-methyl-D-erythritol 4-phosphate cytidylyltransferase
MTIQQSNDLPNQVIAIIPAAGVGVRMSSSKAKQFIDLCGKPILAVTLNHFQKCSLVDKIVVVVPEDDVDYCKREIVDRYKQSKVCKVVAGGKRRQDSVRKGLEAVGDLCKWVLIHDGVRPLVTTELIERVIKAVKKSRAVITGLPVKETVKELDEQGMVLRSVNRSHLWLIQTPQIFQFEDLRLAHQKALNDDWEEATDDAFLIEKMGVPVKIIKGEESNVKVTTPRDLDIARFLMSKKSI